MTRPESSLDALLHSLQERAKELTCLYEVDEILSGPGDSLVAVLESVIEAIPPGWQYSDVCRARVNLDSTICGSRDEMVDDWALRSPITIDGTERGELWVFYTEARPTAHEGPFLSEERRLLETIAKRIGLYVQREEIRSAHDSLTSALTLAQGRDATEWKVILDFLRRTDGPLLATITRKMINYLCWTGVEEAVELLLETVAGEEADSLLDRDQNSPMPRAASMDASPLADRAFRIAGKHQSEDEIVLHIRSWIEEDKAASLIEALETAHNGLADIARALKRFESSDLEYVSMPVPLQRSLGASLIRRFFSDQLGFLGVLRDRVRVSDFADLIKTVVYSQRSRGRLGGKSSGLFLASTLLRTVGLDRPSLARIRIPKSWYITSDALLEFLRYNDLDEVHAHKYQDIERIRKDYPYLVSVFKNSRFPTDLENGIAAALDDFGDSPLIVRSSSLLEDQIGAAFSGKYKSLFLANQGKKEDRLAALLDAVAEVYASIFAPDPIEYRSERGMLDVHEEMAIMIQQVVGVPLGKYFLPSFSGVAFSRNEFRWSPRIRRDDGLVRMVPGLGTRAVDRIGDDYPVLISPGQPGLRVNVSHDEVIRYSPQMVDVINLEENVFQTVKIRDLLAEVGDTYPLARKMVSMVTGDRVRNPVGLEPDWESDELAVTFSGLIAGGEVIEQIGDLVQFLEAELGYPVDLEFASDGTDLYLLQCRAQSASADFASEPIPRHLPVERVLFSANRFVSNGRVPDITHLVYVDPEGYASLGSHADLLAVARAVGRLNHMLPRRQFILIGPGRWGSRGDVKLGVGVGYGDINNTAALIEMAWKRGNYTPEPSFGTHFFQDLVEADIRYLPLYPDEEGVVFNWSFLRDSESVLGQLLPDFSHLESVLRVIDVPRVTDGDVLKILLNADLDEAVGILTSPSVSNLAGLDQGIVVPQRSDDHWRWRILMAESIAAALDADRFGVEGMYVFGSAKNMTAGPTSDLNLIVHFSGTKDQQEGLLLWFDGWSRSLAAVNHLKTGHAAQHLLDVHLVTAQDILEKTNFAEKIGAVTDPARPLVLGGALNGT